MRIFSLVGNCVSNVFLPIRLRLGLSWKQAYPTWSDTKLALAVSSVVVLAFYNVSNVAYLHYLKLENARLKSELSLTQEELTECMQGRMRWSYRNGKAGYGKTIVQCRAVEELDV